MRKTYYYRVKTTSVLGDNGSLVIEEKNDKGIWETISKVEFESIRDKVRVEQILIELNNIRKMESSEIFFQ